MPGRFWSPGPNVLVLCCVTLRWAGCTRLSVSWDGLQLNSLLSSFRIWFQEWTFNTINEGKDIFNTSVR